LLEVILSLAIISLTVGFSMIITQNSHVRVDLDSGAVLLVQNFSRAQILARAVDGDAPWGVRIQDGLLTLFKGSSYASRDTNYDEATDIPATITVSGLQEVVFAKKTGLPQNTGTTTLTSSTNETRTATINSEGMVAH
jgi:type II secretory pathway pseudopilin PulG